MIAYIGCSKTKQNHSCFARCMYQGALFKKAYNFSINNGYRVLILSAKYGLLMPDDVIDPYELTLLSMNINSRKKWANEVVIKIKKMDIMDCSSVMLASKKYYEFLNLLNVEYPLSHLSQGQQLKWLNDNSLKNKGYFNE